jgi:hypothetical protein
MLSFVDEDGSSSSSSSAASSAAPIAAAPTAGNARRPPLRDLEDLLNIRPASANLPLMVEMDLCRGAELLPDAQVWAACGFDGLLVQFTIALTIVLKFVVCDFETLKLCELPLDAQLLHELASLRARFPPDHHFVLKLNGGLVRDLDALNSKIAMLEEASALQSSSARTSGGHGSSVASASGASGPLVVDLSFERLAELAQLPDTVFLRSRVFPCVRYFLAAKVLAADDTVRECEGIYGYRISRILI